MELLLVAHLLAAIIWVGGMFFAYIILRPVAASLLSPPDRLRLWSGIFSRFFIWVWLAIVLLWGSGLGMVFGVYGSLMMMGLQVHLMLAGSAVMTLVFWFLYRRFWPEMRAAVESGQWAQAGSALNRIRLLVAFNLLLGVLVSAVGAGGRYVF
ncbi:CopD family protein [Aestuariirhabdus sp. Z084]|uniref:CopD family protein n=1 Tax=Aestuariirhabdus haliotis TaxID=2918751 RepID=UPI00201B3F94|nr:CopD family protein [Aestuariirhabdus haliotis]MCL6415895.1 CopD family protein [Aestuariirhabdus haliotis]MCL6419893.1 CopD family protein [Aestuariirhabdus haliotis]